MYVFIHSASDKIHIYKYAHVVCVYVYVLSSLITWAKLLEEILRGEAPFLGLDSEQRTPQKGMVLMSSP